MLNIPGGSDSVRIRIDYGGEIFNVLNSKNLLAPQTTNLIFNFDGTVRAGLGDPRQAQVGARIYDLTLRVASGEQAAAEILGHAEFAMLRLGPVY